MFASHGGMHDRGSACNFVMREALFEIYTRILCLSYLHEKQTSRIQSIYLSKLSRFGYEISVFKYTTGRYSEQQPEQAAHTLRHRFHGKMDVNFFSYVYRSRKHWKCKYIIISISKHLLLWMNVMPDFICISFVEVWRTGKERKIQNTNVNRKYMSPPGIEPATPRFPTGCLRPLDNRNRCYVIV